MPWIGWVCKGPQGEVSKLGANSMLSVPLGNEVPQLVHVVTRCFRHDFINQHPKHRSQKPATDAQ
eukprot:1784990-Lingulodinium_polyedra.AAC.1